MPEDVQAEVLVRAEAGATEELGGQEVPAFVQTVGKKLLISKECPVIQ